MSNDLRIRVLFDMVDRMTRPLRTILSGNNDLANSLKSSRDELKVLGKTQKDIGTFREMRTGLVGAKRDMQGAQARVAELARAMGSTTSPTRQMSEEFERAKRTAAQLTAAHGQQSNRVNELRTRLSAAGIDTRNLSEHERTLRASIAATNARMTEQQARLAELTARTRRLTEARERMNRTRELAGSMAGTGAKMMAGGAVVGAATLVPVAAYAKAEDSATQLSSALMRAGGVVPPEFEKINTLAMKLGDRLPGTTSDFQDMMTMLTRQGISAQSILGGMGEATAYLAVQLKKTPAEAAEFTAKLQDATRTAEKDMLSLTDVIQKAFMLGVDDNNMLQGFAKLGPAMDTIKQKGIEGAKALAPLLVMADQSGMEGSAAGNAYRKVFQLGMDKTKVAKANKQLAPAQKIDFTDGKGEFGGLDNMFKQFAKLKGLTTQKQLGVMKTVFGDDAETLQVISLMIEKGKAGYDEVQAKMAAQASMQERVNKQLGTLKNLWEAAGGTFTNGLVAMGEAIAPEIKSAVEWLGDMAQRMGTFARENPRLTNGIMKAVVALALLLTVGGGLMVMLAGILGPLAIVKFSMTALGMQGGILARVFGGLGGLLRGGFVGSLKMVGQAFMMLGRLVMANPLLAVIGLIAMAAVYVWSNWDTLGPKFAALWTWIKTAAGAAWDWIGNKVSMAWEDVKGATGAAWGWLDGKLSGMWKSITEGAGAAWDWVGDKISTGWETIKGATGAAWDWLGGKLSGIWETVKGAFSGGIEGIAALILNWSPLGLFYQAFAGVMSWFGIDMPAKFTEFGANILSGLVNGITNGLGAVRDAITNVASSTVGWFKEKLGIHSPSVVFGELGGFISQGAALGIDAEQGRVIKAVASLATAATVAFGNPQAAIAAAMPQAAIAAARPLIGQDVPIDTRPPLAARPAAGNQTPAPAAPSQDQYVFNIYGGDQKETARQIRDVIEQIEREKRSRSASSLSDTNY